MFKKHHFVLFSSLLFFAQWSWAGTFVFSPALSHTSRNSEEAGNNIKTKITNIDLRLGYAFGMGLYIGGMYSLVDANESGNNVSEFYVAPTIGYTFQNFYSFLSYIVSSEQDVSANNASKYSGGNGIQVDLGYNVQVTDTFYLGPMLSWRSVNWNENQVGGISQSGFTGRDMASLTPYVVLWFAYQ